MMAPAVSVVMPCHTDKYLAEAVQSILDQTFRDFELIAICDPTESGAGRVLNRIKDPQLIPYSTFTKANVSTKMNLARALVRGKYVARMDSDDVAHPDRLRKQVKYLDAHPEVGAIGTQIDYIDESGNPLKGPNLPTSYAGILFALPRYNPIANPTTMMRADLFRHLWYDPTITTVEDYDYWVRASREIRIRNLPDHLHKYRIHPGQISNSTDERDKWLPIVQGRARGIFWERLGGLV